MAKLRFGYLISVSSSFHQVMEYRETADRETVERKKPPLIARHKFPQKIKRQQTGKKGRNRPPYPPIGQRGRERGQAEFARLKSHGADYRGNRQKK
jgi:hypothetical protein